MIRRVLATVGVSALLVTSIYAPGGAQDADVAAAGVNWSACPPVAEGQPSLADFECATVKVPLNYNKPAGRKITLGMVKHPATSGTSRGTIFFNPGGPSDQGSVFLPALVDGFGKRIVSNYDLVSWDPRGMGGMSTPVVQCFPSLEKEEKFLAPAPFPPLNKQEMQKWGSLHSTMFTKCGKGDVALLKHVSTADNARDMESMRKALGLKKLSYYGTSYGTFLGATFANMFPKSYEHMVLDGAINPVAWTQAQGRLSTFMRAGSDKASAATLQSFLEICGKKSADKCPFSAGTPKKTVNKFNKLIKAAEKGITTPDGPLTANDIVGITFASLYIVQPVPGSAKFVGWTGLAEYLQQFWELSKGASSTSAALSAKDSYMGAERQSAVVCGESPNPTNRDAYVKQAQKSLKDVGVGGAAWTWIGYCADWPAKAQSPYLGPWDNVGKPIVVVGTTGDPATPYSNAVAASRLLPGARLITVDGYGHTELANPSKCVQQRLADYFLKDKLPKRNAPDCQQNTKPFAG